MKNKKMCFLPLQICFFFFLVYATDEIAFQENNPEQTDEVYPFTSCYVYACLSLKDVAAGQKHLIRGVHVGTKQQFTHLAGLSSGLQGEASLP